MPQPRFGVWAPVYGTWGAKTHPTEPLDAGYARTRDLLLKAARAAIPEHRASVREIPQGRRVTLERAAWDALPLRLAVGKSLGPIMAARAGAAVVDRKPRVIAAHLDANDDRRRLLLDLA